MVTKNVPQQLLWHGSKLADQMVRCGDCRTPVMEVRGGSLYLLDVHHGERHENVIRVAKPLDRKA